MPAPEDDGLSSGDSDGEEMQQDPLPQVILQDCPGELQLLRQMQIQRNVQLSLAATQAKESRRRLKAANDRTNTHAKITPFSKTGPSEYISYRYRFLEVKKCNRWDDSTAKSQLVINMADEAAATISHLVAASYSSDPEISFTEFLKMVNESFLSTADSTLAKNDFHEALQGNEKVAAWCNRLKTLCTRAYPDEDLETSKILMFKFHTGCRSQFVKDELTRARPTNMKEFLDAAALAQAMISIRRTGQPGRSGNIHALAPEEYYEDHDVREPYGPIPDNYPKSLNQMGPRSDRRDRPPPRRTPRTDAGPRRRDGGDRGDGCWRCGLTGHIQINCRTTALTAPKDTNGFKTRATFTANKSKAPLGARQKKVNSLSLLQPEYDDTMTSLGN